MAAGYLKDGLRIVWGGGSLIKKNKHKKQPTQQSILPRIKRLPVHKRGVVMVPNMVSGLRLSDANFRNEVSVHDYISVHRAGVALHRGSARREEEKSNVADKHDIMPPKQATKKLKNFSSEPEVFVWNLFTHCTQWLQMRNSTAAG